MPKTKDEIRAENSIKAFKAALIRLGSSGNKCFGQIVADKLLCTYKTGLKRVRSPEGLTIREIRLLKLTDYEILQIVRGEWSGS